jgi:hypothetical protein
MTVPLYGGPPRVIVTGFATAAELGLKSSRRGAARDARPGSEVFQTLCGMMATGARTILLSRWRTGGRTNLELVREFARVQPQLPATEAWQRACLLAREAPLDAKNEPRLKGLEDSGELPTADHPFFWAGYLLVDTSPRSEEREEPAGESDVDLAAPSKDNEAPPIKSSAATGERQPDAAPLSDSATAGTSTNGDSKARSTAD